MKVSFDFDGTIESNEQLQLLAKTLIQAETEVFILTSRHYDNEKLVKETYEFASKIGIKKENVIFSPIIEKWKHIKNLNINLHFDDNSLDIEQINKNLPYRGMYVGYEMFPELNDENII